MELPRCPYFYVFVTGSARLPGMDSRCFKLQVSSEVLATLESLGDKAHEPQLLGQLFHPSVASKLSVYHLFPVIYYCLFCLFVL